MPTSEELYAKANRQKARELIKQADKLLRQSSDSAAIKLIEEALSTLGLNTEEQGEQGEQGE